MQDWEKEKDVEIDLLQILTVIWKKLWIIVLAAILTAAAVFGGTYFVVTPVYEAEAMLYINNSRTAGNPETISAADLTAAQSLTETYVVILGSKAVLNEIAGQTGDSYSTDELKNMISATAVNGTELLRISVCSKDPEEASDLANAAASVSAEKMMETVEGSSVKIVDQAAIPAKPASPNYLKNMLMGFLIGLLISIGIVIIKDLRNTSIRSENQLNTLFEEIPILGVIPLPNQRNSQIRNYGYAYQSTAYVRDDIQKENEKNGASQRGNTGRDSKEIRS